MNVTEAQQMEAELAVGCDRDWLAAFGQQCSHVNAMNILQDDLDDVNNALAHCNASQTTR